MWNRESERERGREREGEGQRERERERDGSHVQGTMPSLLRIERLAASYTYYLPALRNIAPSTAGFYFEVWLSRANGFDVDTI